MEHPNCVLMGTPGTQVSHTHVHKKLLTSAASEEYLSYF